MNKSKILDRIEQLLRRTKERGATEAEAEQAVLYARKLMEQHNIELAEVLEAKGETLDEDSIAEEIVKQSSRIAPMEKTLAAVVCKICDCDWFIRNRTQLIIYGVQEDVDAAQVLFLELLIVIKSLARQRYGNRWGRSHWHYSTGFCHGLNRKLKEEIAHADENAGTALILHKHQLIANHARAIGIRVTKARPIRIDDRVGAYQQGRIDGSAYEISQGSRRLN